ncbi:MAG: FG-GAP-like repeat-containing protein [Arenicellales bacterium]|nr:FG-GAP-like repeat-containing protein [Arenicellales bacterium]
MTVNYASSSDSLSFTAADIATSANGAFAVHVADMDGDGDLDIISASSFDDTIAWYENDGAANPSWTAADIATSADGAKAVYVADMDGDGDLDIVSASKNDDTIAWYENDGEADPSWSAANIATSADGAKDVYIADMDSDGDLDIVSASSTDDTIAWYENDGAVNPSWTAANIATSADGAWAVHVADMDADGDLDIVSASQYDDTIAWYENDGEADPSWSAANIATSADSAKDVHVADMDADGDLDIVSASHNDDTIAWYENDGASDPTWTAVNIATSANGAYAVHIADMDMDGDLDIVSASKQDDTIAWYENDGAADPSWTAADIAISADSALDIYVADMDGDGDLDIVSASSNDDTIAWYESNAADKNLDTNALAGTDYTASSGTLTFDAGDTTATFTVPVLADSAPENDEIVTMTLSSASNATLSDAIGTLTITDDDSISFTAANIDTSSANGAKGVYLADMDSDGDLDIVAASSVDDTISWFENDGASNPNFTAANIATTANGAADVVVRDMDGDGDLDIVSASSADNTIAWYENDGAANPSWSAANIATSAGGAYSVDVADMDGDGDLDIVSASDTDNTIAWYENDGAADPSWSATDIATSAEGARGVSVADMDGDGDIDIVSASRDDDTIAWYENDGAANPSWTAADIATSADGALSAKVADMDGDGDMDIISASYLDDTIAWYENDGEADPTWTAANIATSADGASDLEAMDMDGDGDMDIVSASRTDDTIAWYENDGAANPSWTAVDIDTNANWARDVQIGDLDGDGDLDIVSASKVDDTIAWYENDCDGSDPIVLDLDGDGIELLGIGSGVTFDVDADGMGESVGWFGPDDGMLVMDLDGSGAIENMNEVFSEVFNGESYADSLSALASLDTNTDQVISAGDKQFDDILVWQDIDSDGVSAAPELSTLSDRGITSISLDAQSVSETLGGNRIEAVGEVTLTDDATSTYAEVTFVVAGAPTTFSLGGVISTVIASDERIETAFVVDGHSGTATAGLVETTETLTLDELSPASIASIIEGIEASTGTEVLTSDADISVTESAVAETSVAEVASEGESETAVAASESEIIDEEPEAAIEASEVDGYAVYVPASDPAPVSEPLSLAA